MSVYLLQVCKAQVKSGGDGILSGAVWWVGKLEGVKHGRESGDVMILFQPFKLLYHNRCECDGPLVIE